MMKAGQFFDGFADEFDTFYDGKRARMMRWVDDRFRSDMRLRFEMTFGYLGDLRGKTVLDIGCGSGPYMAEALKRGALQVTGIDSAPRMLELADQRVRELGRRDSVELLEGYFPETAPRHRCDVGIVMGVMDYIDDPTTFIRAVRANVTESAVLSFPSTHWFRTPFRQVRYMLRHCPVYFYTEQKIKWLMQETGVKQYGITKIDGAGMDYFVSLIP